MPTVLLSLSPNKKRGEGFLSDKRGVGELQSCIKTVRPPYDISGPL